jgi:hypothetical protein
MRTQFFIFSLFVLIISSCTTNQKSSGSSEIIEGKWELVKEVANKKTLDCSDDPVKTVLSLQENFFFVQYDDLENSALGKNVAKIQTQYSGQYKRQGKSFTMKYEAEGEDLTDTFQIVELTRKKLVILNKQSVREFHYIRR